MQTITKSPKPSRIMVIEDHPIARRGISRLLDQQPDLQVCGEAEEVEKALKLIHKLVPDLVLLDLSLKQSNGMVLLDELKASGSKVPVLVISMHDQTLYAERVLQQGAKGYVMKQEDPDHVLKAIRKVLGGSIYVDSKLEGKILSRMARSAGNVTLSVQQRLSPRESEVYRLIGQGRGSRDIAEAMGVSIKTIEVYREKIKAKLGLHTAAQLVQHAIHWNSDSGENSREA